MPQVYCDGTDICIGSGDVIRVPAAEVTSIVDRLEEVCFDPLPRPKGSSIALSYNGEWVRIEQNGHSVNIYQSEVDLLIELLLDCLRNRFAFERPKLTWYEQWLVYRWAKLEKARLERRERAEHDPVFAERLRRDSEQEAEDQATGLYSSPED